eukprot:TRINITY_DN12951_c2_g1_i1.p1 TRINITY_DN12951_c2_g1~~TRINITY_DN12951_c2_g1_i1.p1  ORF type:complete len:225 (+),score=-1.40 TRINITY_DN12951_c2_g1_i1:709-1383(+)
MVGSSRGARNPSAQVNPPPQMVTTGLVSSTLLFLFWFFFLWKTSLATWVAGCTTFPPFPSKSFLKAVLCRCNEALFKGFYFVVVAVWSLSFLFFLGCQLPSVVKEQGVSGAFVGQSFFIVAASSPLVLTGEGEGRISLVFFLSLPFLFLFFSKKILEQIVCTLFLHFFLLLFSSCFPRKLPFQVGCRTFRCFLSVMCLFRRFFFFLRVVAVAFLVSATVFTSFF